MKSVVVGSFLAFGTGVAAGAAPRALSSCTGGNALVQALTLRSLSGTAAPELAEITLIVHDHAYVITVADANGLIDVHTDELSVSAALEAE